MCESVKKHFSQMSNTEKNLINNKLNNLGVLELSFHVKEQMINRNIYEEDIYNVLNDYVIIEFHRKINDYGKVDNRVLIRSNNSINGRNVCLSISLDKSRVITCYSNDCNDSHTTIDMNNYNCNCDIREYIDNERINNRLNGCSCNLVEAYL